MPGLLNTFPRAALATLAAAGAIALASPRTTASAPVEGATAELRRLADEATLRRIPTEIEIAVDRKDWPTARAHFATEVRIDFTSLVGGTPATVPADALIAGWSGNLKGNKSSLHIRGDALVTISGDKAVIRSNGYAWNRMPGATDGAGDLWEVWGHYTHEMTRGSDGWKVTAFTFEKTHERGSIWVKTTPGQ